MDGCIVSALSREITTTLKIFSVKRDRGESFSLTPKEKKSYMVNLHSCHNLIGIFSCRVVRYDGLKISPMNKSWTVI